MKKLFQKDWFGINFSEIGIELSKKEIAGIEFYSSFYQAFFKKFKNYDELPEEWRSLKDEIVNHLNGQLNLGDRILSIGCGTGYIESQLKNKNNQIEIVGIEPGKDLLKWCNNDISILEGLFPDALLNIYSAGDFNFVYASGIDYVFDD